MSNPENVPAAAPKCLACGQAHERTACSCCGKPKPCQRLQKGRPLGNLAELCDGCVRRQLAEARRH